MAKVTNTSLLTQVLLVKDGDGSKSVSIAPDETADLDLFDRGSAQILVLERMGALKVDDAAAAASPQAAQSAKPSAAGSQSIGTTQAAGTGTAGTAASNSAPQS